VINSSPKENFILEEKVVCTKAIKRDSGNDEWFSWEYKSLSFRPFLFKESFPFYEDYFQARPLNFLHSYELSTGDQTQKTELLHSLDLHHHTWNCSK
jgi:hypothetical protein